jgi:hypothetical protein
MALVVFSSFNVEATNQQITLKEITSQNIATQEHMEKANAVQDFLLGRFCEEVMDGFRGSRFHDGFPAAWLLLSKAILDCMGGAPTPGALVVKGRCSALFGRLGCSLKSGSQLREESPLERSLWEFGLLSIGFGGRF